MDIIIGGPGYSAARGWYKTDTDCSSTILIKKILLIGLGHVTASLLANTVNAEAILGRNERSTIFSYFGNIYGNGHRSCNTVFTMSGFKATLSQLDTFRGGDDRNSGTLLQGHREVTKSLDTRGVYVDKPTL